MLAASAIAPAAVLALAALAPVGAAADDEAPGPSPSAVSASPSATAASPSETAEPSPSPSPSATNQPPQAYDDTATVTAGRSVTVDVLANDTDDASPPRLEVVAVTGTRATHTPTDVTFHARAGDEGSYSVRYTVSDGELTSEATLRVDVRPVTTRTVSLTLATRPVVLHRYLARGTVTPPAARPVVVLQRRTASGWVQWGRDRPDDRGRWSVPFRTDRPGRYVLRAVARWSDGSRTRSATTTRQVRTVLDLHVSGPLTRRGVPYSWRAGCPVAPQALRKITMNHVDYRGRVARGALVVRASAVPAVTRVFRRAFAAGFPVKSMHPTDHYYAGGHRTPTQSDVAAMRAGNTAAFNCRPVTGNPYRISQHSYGNAIDINTVENPYVTGSRVYPSFASRYLNRSTYRKGMILPGGVIATQMRKAGWPWGARWAHPDYQHFSSNGG